MKRMMVAGAALAILAGCNQSGGNASTAAANGAKAAEVKPPAGGDWTQTVAATPEGGFRMGNPNAAIKLVEWGSLTCSHCAEFSEKATDPLKQLVASGKLSWEYRSYVRDQMDMTLALLARCGGPAPFFPMVEQIYADQKGLFAKLEASSAQLANIGSLPPAQQFEKLATTTGMLDFVAQRGVSAPQAKTCLADQATTDRLVKMVDTANKSGLPGTPTFLINGTMVPNVATWEALQPALKAAGA